MHQVPISLVQKNSNTRSGIGSIASSSQLGQMLAHQHSQGGWAGGFKAFRVQVTRADPLRADSSRLKVWYGSAD